MENSKTLWIFGDSFSTPWEKTSGTHKEYVEKYNPKYHFADILHKELECTDVNNLAIAGWDNYSIMESIGNVVSQIQPQDYVIIGWSETIRYRNTIMNPGQWTTVSVKYESPPLDESFDRTHWHQESVSRDCSLTSMEVDSWIAILHHAIPNNLLNWTPSPKKYWSGDTIPINVNRPPFKLDYITEKTDIEDWHITDRAHFHLGNWMVNVLENDDPNGILKNKLI